jgi:hypothetical protein
MIRIFLLFIFLFSIPSIIQCDLTNLNDFLRLLKQNSSINYPIGHLSQANIDVVKRYLPGNIIEKKFDDKDHLLQALDNETIIGRK